MEWSDTIQAWGTTAVNGWIGKETAPDPAQTTVQMPSGQLVNANTQTPAGLPAMSAKTIVIVVGGVLAVVAVVVLLVRR